MALVRATQQTALPTVRQLVGDLKKLAREAASAPALDNLVASLDALDAHGARKSLDVELILAGALTPEDAGIVATWIGPGFLPSKLQIAPGEQPVVDVPGTPLELRVQVRHLTSRLAQKAGAPRAPIAVLVAPRPLALTPDEKEQIDRAFDDRPQIVLLACTRKAPAAAAPPAEAGAARRGRAGGSRTARRRRDRAGRRRGSARGSGRPRARRRRPTSRGSRRSRPGPRPPAGRRCRTSTCPTRRCRRASDRRPGTSSTTSSARTASPSASTSLSSVLRHGPGAGPGRDAGQQVRGPAEAGEAGRRQGRCRRHRLTHGRPPGRPQDAHAASGRGVRARRLRPPAGPAGPARGPAGARDRAGARRPAGAAAREEEQDAWARACPPPSRRRSTSSSASGSAATARAISSP